MILVGNARSHGQNLAAHLLNDRDNDFVEMHEVRGFASDDLHGAFAEAEAISRGTRAQKYLFSLSLNPPADQFVPIEIFEEAIERAEKTLNLHGQPRAIVFHEKRGPEGVDRRHCHVVWSRIDPETMKARPQSFHKLKLNELAKALYLEHGWDMPRGFQSKEEAQPTNYHLAEAQQAKRLGDDPRKLKAFFQEAWANSDDRASFVDAVSEAGFALARGDRRGAVLVDQSNEIYAVSRWCGVKVKDVRAKLGDEQELLSTEEARDALKAPAAANPTQKRRQLKSALSRETKRDKARRDHLIQQQRLEREVARAGLTAHDLKTAIEPASEAPSANPSTKSSFSLTKLWKRGGRSLKNPTPERVGAEFDVSKFLPRRLSEIVHRQLRLRGPNRSNQAMGLDVGLKIRDRQPTLENLATCSAADAVFIELKQHSKSFPDFLDRCN